MPDAAAPSLLDRLLRPGSVSTRDVWIDLFWLLGLAALLMGAGLGLRDPWPADEPRFALVAQDMLRSHDWLIPRIGGDLYPDKPPLYFWLMAVAIALTGSLRVGFLLPSLFAGLATLLLVYDALRRARGREVALAGGLVLLATVQFVWQSRQAQIDATLCFFTTLSLYGLLRHVVTGPSIRWYWTAWVAAGLGVITKGVGFLPLLLLLPWAALAARGWPTTERRRHGRWIVGLLLGLAAIGMWFVPMMLATSAGGELLQYRNDILFHQTVTRYADAWHHRAPPWFYVLEVVPVLWLPVVALLPWLAPRWRDAIRARDTFVAVLLCWVVIVLAFFSASPGKRGVYVLPALPALAMAAAPWLPELLRLRGTRVLAFLLAAAISVGAALGAVYFAVDGVAAERIADDLGIAPAVPLAIVALAGAATTGWLRLRDAWLAFGGVLAAALLTVGLYVYPRIDGDRSGRDFMRKLEQASADVSELGLVSAKEQYLLQLRRPSFNFGHARWREKAQEAADAAAWLAQKQGRALLVDAKTRELCFREARARDLGRANGEQWSLVTGPAAPGCVARGDLAKARLYVPANGSTNTVG